MSDWYGVWSGAGVCASKREAERFESIGQAVDSLQTMINMGAVGEDCTIQMYLDDPATGGNPEGAVRMVPARVTFEWGGEVRLAPPHVAARRN